MVYFVLQNTPFSEKTLENTRKGASHPARRRKTVVDLVCVQQAAASTRNPDCV